MKFGFIGAGKVGTTLSIYLQKMNHLIVGFYSQSLTSAKKAAAYTESIAYTDIRELIYQSDFIFITTTDNGIRQVVEKIMLLDPIEGKFFAHTSGVHSSKVLDPLEVMGNYVYSIHPIQSFAHIEVSVEKLKETYFTIEGSQSGMVEIKELMDRLGNPYSIIKAEQKALYHAGACVISNYMTTLLNLGFSILKEAGLEEKLILPMFEPLIESTLDNIKESGPIKALTGPILRGDMETVQKHLDHISKNALPFYKLMAKETLQMIRGKRILEEDYQQWMTFLRMDEDE